MCRHILELKRHHVHTLDKSPHCILIRVGGGDFQIGNLAGG
jgi:hypothetical protein